MDAVGLLIAHGVRVMGTLQVNLVLPCNGSSPNVELSCNKINELQGIAVLVATNMLQQNQWVTDFEVKMGLTVVTNTSA